MIDSLSRYPAPVRHRLVYLAVTAIMLVGLLAFALRAVLAGG